MTATETKLTEPAAAKLYSYGYMVGIRFPGTDAEFIRPVPGAGPLPLSGSPLGDAVSRLRGETGLGARVRPDFLLFQDRLVLHFEFADGSNPYVFFGDHGSVLAELDRWARNWTIRPLKHDGRTLYARLSEKPRSRRPPCPRPDDTTGRN